MTEQRLSTTGILIGGPLDGKEALIQRDQTVVTATLVSHQYPPSGPETMSYRSEGTTDDQDRVVFSFDQTPS